MASQTCAECAQEVQKITGICVLYMYALALERSLPLAPPTNNVRSPRCHSRSLLHHESSVELTSPDCRWSHAASRPTTLYVRAPRYLGATEYSLFTGVYTHARRHTVRHSHRTQRRRSRFTARSAIETRDTCLRVRAPCSVLAPAPPPSPTSYDKRLHMEVCAAPLTAPLTPMISKRTQHQVCDNSRIERAPCCAQSRGLTG